MTPENRRIEGADVTCWGRLFQVRAAATGKPGRRRWIAVYAGHSTSMMTRNGGVPRSRNQPRAQLTGEVRRRCPVQTLVHKNSEPELDPLRRSQPVQPVEERSDTAATDEKKTSCAAESTTDRRRWRRYDGMPARVALP